MTHGREFGFFVDETQSNYAASVERIGAEVDPVSQTIKLYAKLKNIDQRVLAGMSGTAVFQNVGI